MSYNIVKVGLYLDKKRKKKKKLQRSHAHKARWGTFRTFHAEVCLYVLQHAKLGNIYITQKQQNSHMHMGVCICIREEKKKKTQQSHKAR